MSGIAGFVNLDGRPADLDSAHRMIDQIKTRGSDGFDFHKDDSCALGHAHLFSTPESENESQPYVDPTTKLTITADVRLDNRSELISALSLEYLPPDTIGDAQLILNAYLQWGGKCPEHLLGDFSFAIWDPRHQILFGARDHFGIKPFVYHHDSKLFAFASQAKAVLACNGVPQKVSEERIADFLVPWLEGIDHTSTFFENVFRLPPAHTITVSSGSISVHRYWKLEPPPELKLNSDEEYIEAFHNVFTKAVERRMRGGDRVGSMLSGGLDSSSIVAIARDLCPAQGNKPLKTFSAILPDDEPFKETDCVQAVIDQGRIAPETITTDEYVENAQSYQELATITDNPFDFQMDVFTAVYNRAHQTGIRAVMDGIDGDLATSLSTRYLLYLVKGGHFLSAISETLGCSRHFGNSRLALRRLFDCAIPALLPSRLWQHARNRRRRIAIKETILHSFICPMFAERIDVENRIGALYDRELPSVESSGIAERQALILGMPFLTVALEDYDGIAARYGVEPLHPFLDLELVHFCLSLPWRQKVRKGSHKWILRQAIGPMLPKQVQQRSDEMHPGLRFAKSALHREMARNPMEPQWDPTNPILEYINHPTIPNSVENSPLLFLSYWLKHWQ